MARGKATLDALIEKIIAGASGDDAQFAAFYEALRALPPFEGFVMDQPVSVVAFNYDGNTRRGVTAQCRGENGLEHVVAAADVTMPGESPCARNLAAYRKWLKLPADGPSIPASPPTVDGADDSPVELVVLGAKQKSARCRALKSGLDITVRIPAKWDPVPGEIVVLRPNKQWTYAGHPYMSGAIESSRVDASALGLVPLKLEAQGVWDPEKHYWGEANDPIEDWAKPIIIWGPRREFEMEQVLPGEDPEDLDTDPIIESNELIGRGDYKGGRKMLMDLCEADLRCLDAHSHLGLLEFNSLPRLALRHYEVGVRIGELSLGEGFIDSLPWGMINNRPFLRCLHGYGLCLWRLGGFEEAADIFNRMLWLNPTDNQGVRFSIDEVRSKTRWTHQDESF